MAVLYKAWIVSLFANNSCSTQWKWSLSRVLRNGTCVLYRKWAQCLKFWFKKMVRRTAFFKKSDPKTKTFKAYNTGYSQAVSHPGTNLALQVWLRWSDENRYFSCDVVVDKRQMRNLAIWVARLVLKFSGFYAFVLLLFYTCKVTLGSGLFSTRHGLFPFLQTIPVLRNGN